MTNRLFSFSIINVLILSSCQNQNSVKPNHDTTQIRKTVNYREPNYNYFIDVPKDWRVLDSSLQGGLKVRFILPPSSLITDLPTGNVIIAKMDVQDITDFTTRNMDYLKSNMAGVKILERGNIDSSLYNGQWFTYTREQNGVVRDMINYIIPLNGFAYMITCGTKKGSMSKYIATFNKIAKSFKG